MNDRFDKHTSIKEVHEILKDNCIPSTTYSDLVIGLMLINCDYIEIVGYGHNAKLNMIKNDN